MALLQQPQQQPLLQLAPAGLHQQQPLQQQPQQA
jgi:hypothetical protein